MSLGSKWVLTVVENWKSTISRRDFIKSDASWKSYSIQLNFDVIILSFNILFREVSRDVRHS